MLYIVTDSSVRQQTDYSFRNMSRTYYRAVMADFMFLLAILLSLEVGAGSAADDDGNSCSSCTLREVASLIREEFQDVKNLVATNQINAMEASKQALASALVRKYMHPYKRVLELYYCNTVEWCWWNSSLI